MNAAPTIRTLAKMAGVSNATVSLALRNSPRIRPEVRERIQKFAAEAGYQTNAVMAHLLAQVRASKTSTYQSTLGLLYVGNKPAVLKVIPTFREWIAGCQERATSLGYGLDRFSLLESSVSPERFIKILHARNISGLVIIGPFENSVLPPELDPLWDHSAAIVIGVRPIHPALAFVSNDQFSTAAHAVQELVRLGYQRPGLCIEALVDDSVEGRFSGGYHVAQNRLTPENRIPAFDYEPNAEGRFKSWVKSHRPDVIIALHLEIEAWVKSMGLSVPEDIGLVHLDKSSEVRWAGMRQNNEHIGRAAVDMVIGQLHRNEFGVPPFQKCMFISSTWVPGWTVRKQRRGSRGRPRSLLKYPCAPRESALGWMARRE